MYEYGRGVVQDYNQALVLYKKACHLNNTESQKSKGCKNIETLKKELEL